MIISKTRQKRLAEQKEVKELLAVLKENNFSSAKDLMAAIGHVSDLEEQLSSAVQELTAMWQELQEMKQSPLKAALQRSVQTLEAKVSQLRGQIEVLKENIIEGCKQALTDFKQRGTAALDGVPRFFHLREVLEGVKETIQAGIATDEKALAKIEAVSAEYHEAGRHLKYVGRALMGKEAVSETKGPGKLVKAVAAPYRAERACLLSMQNSVEKALARIERLEQAAEKKPSILGTMRTQNEKIRAEPGKESPPAKHGER